MRPNDQSRVVLSISPEMRAIYDANFALVWRYMAQRGVRQAQLDDLVHRVFRVVREHPGRREPNLRANVLACMVARQVLREFRRTNFGLFETRAGDVDAPTEIFERGAAQELLFGGLETLTEVERDVFLLCEGEHMSTEDVADALGIMESSVQRRRASANKQMQDFVGKLRKSGVWRGSTSPYGHDLLEAAQAACTPTERDSDRVFAAMIAHSMTSPLEFAPTEMVPAPRLPSLPPPIRMDRIPSLPPPLPETEAVARTAAQTWPPRVARYHRRVLWSAAGAMLLTFSLAGYFFSPTNADGPTPARAAAPQPMAAQAPAQRRPLAPVGGLAAAPKAKAAPAAAQPPKAKAAPAAPAPSKSEVLDGKTRVPALKEAAAAPKQKSAPAPQDDAAAKAKQARAPAERPAESDEAREARLAEAAARAAKRDQAAEAKLLFAAERNYRGGAPELALEMVANHRRRYPDSALAMERDVLRAQILCTQGRHRDVRRIVAELEAANATPAALDTVERACSKKEK